jgi:hypothetical protein
MVQHISSELSHVALVYVSVLLDICLAEATGMTRLLVEHTLPDELKAIEKLRANLADKTQLLTKRKGGLSDAHQALENLSLMLHGMKGRLPANSGVTVRV